MCSRPSSGRQRRARATRPPAFLVTALLALPLAVAAQNSADARSNNEMARLTLCLVDADIAVATLTQMAGGRSLAEVEQAVEATLPNEPAYREYVKRSVSAIYAVQPKAPRVWLAQRLRACAGGASKAARVTQAESCYQLTHYAKALFEARDRGAPLDEALAIADRIAAAEGLSGESRDSLKRMARTVYGSGTGVTQFRTGLFVSCVLPRQP